MEIGGSSTGILYTCDSGETGCDDTIVSFPPFIERTVNIDFDISIIRISHENDVVPLTIIDS